MSRFRNGKITFYFDSLWFLIEIRSLAESEIGGYWRRNRYFGKWLSELRIS